MLRSTEDDPRRGWGLQMVAGLVAWGVSRTPTARQSGPRSGSTPEMCNSFGRGCANTPNRAYTPSL